MIYLPVLLVGVSLIAIAFFNFKVAALISVYALLTAVAKETLIEKLFPHNTFDWQRFMFLTTPIVAALGFVFLG